MTPSRRAEIEALAKRCESHPSRRGLAPVFRELLADNERLEKRAKEQTIALTGLTCGGSEFFVREGEAFYADIDACVTYVRDRQSDQHREIVKRVGLQKAAEAKLAKAKEAIARAVNLPRPEMRTVYDFMARFDRLRDAISEIEDR